MFYQLRGMHCIETLIWEFQFKYMHAIGRQTMLLTQRHEQGINIHSDKVSKISGMKPLFPKRCLAPFSLLRI